MKSNEKSSFMVRNRCIFVPIKIVIIIRIVKIILSNKQWDYLVYSEFALFWERKQYIIDQWFPHITAQ